MRRLTDQQKHELCALSAVGCRRETAAQYAGCTPEEVRAAAAEDAGFAERLGRAEAAIELAHMRCVQQAIRDEKNYRAAIWWLENAAPDGYQRRASEALTRAELRRLLGEITAAVEGEVRSEDDRRRLAARLAELADAAAGGPAQ